ncbi:hypothetical protein VMCG_05197 [Cytospora schulzeri]|uniref:Zn(2)-C6 fungal-type domain-containing protein n=1 Tax=Cytospora schulzeri TaxID=448051 RepID=A0A423WR28_9PEZI|nr:hypothetical protein VMCG_05197 [Valsa malicola]
MPTSCPPESPRQPKLRSSCDACGTVKLRCDRKHPECGRCVAHGITCTYSISRKLGNPPRNRIRNRSESMNARNGTRLGHSLSTNSLDESLMSYTCEPLNGSNNNNNNRSNHNDNDNKDDDNNNDDGDDDDGDDDENDNGYNSNSNNSNGYNSNHDSHTIFDFEGVLDDSLLSGIPLSEFPSLDFGDSAGADRIDSHVAASLRPPSFTLMDQPLELDSIGGSHHATGQHPSGGIGISFMGGTNHDCYREAHEMLGSLLNSHPNWNRQRHGDLEKTPPRGGAFTPHNRLHGQMTLDQVLLLNGKAVERLSYLLTCPCAGSPHLMMLYASTISAILTRYQQAAGSSPSRPSPTWDHSPTWGDPLALHHASSSSTEGISSAGPTCIGGPMVTPARISIGVFSVDDPRVQSALNIRLLISEVRGVSGLIDQIASYHAGGPLLGGGSNGGHVDGMYQSLAMWLRGEHARVTDVIRNRLRELEN